MFSSIGLTVCALVFITIISIFYFVKKKHRTLENDIFTMILIFTIFLLFLEIGCVYMMSIRHIYPIFNEVLCRAYILGVMIWINIILIYLHTLGRDMNDKKLIDILKNKFLFFGTVVELSLFIISCFLEIEFTSGIYNEWYVINGTGVYVLYVAFALLCGYIIYILVSNKHNTSLYKRLPLMLFIFFLLLLTIIQLMTYDFNDLTFLFTFCVVAIYFTIENPDYHLMEELEVANINAEKANKEKTEFLSQMSHEIRTPLNSIMGYSQSIMNNKNLSL